MKRLRLSILGMIVIIVAFAMAFAALRTASDLWFSAVYTLTTVLLLVAVIAARFRRGREGAFWFGFAVFGWGFFFLEMGPWTAPFAGSGLNFARDDDDQVMGGLNRRLITSKLVYSLVPHLRKQTDDLKDIDKITANTIGISHLLITLSLAFCGGIIAALLRKRRAARPNTVVTSLAILGVLSLTTAYTLSGDFSRPSAQFFPDLVFGEKNVSEFTVEWYSKHLNAMSEPSLWMLSRRDRDATVYRLLWLPSFDHPVCVRIDRTKLRAKVLDGEGGYEPGQVAIDKSISLGDEQWRRLERHLEEADFWNMPTKLQDDGGCDGDQLIVEGVRGGTYHIVDRWGPDVTYARLCHYMLDLTGLKMQEDWEGYHSEESNL